LSALTIRKIFVRPWFPADVGGKIVLVGRRNSPKAYAIRKTSAAGLVVMYIEGRLGDKRG